MRHYPPRQCVQRSPLPQLPAGPDAALCDRCCRGTLRISPEQLPPISNVLTTLQSLFWQRRSAAPRVSQRRLASPGDAPPPCWTSPCPAPPSTRCRPTGARSSPPWRRRYPPSRLRVGEGRICQGLPSTASNWLCSGVHSTLSTTHYPSLREGRSERQRRRAGRRAARGRVGGTHQDQSQTRRRQMPWPRGPRCTSPSTSHCSRDLES